MVPTCGAKGKIVENVAAYRKSMAALRRGKSPRRARRGVVRAGHLAPEPK